MWKRIRFYDKLILSQDLDINSQYIKLVFRGPALSRDLDFIPEISTCIYPLDFILSRPLLGFAESRVLRHTRTGTLLSRRTLSFRPHAAA